MSWRYKLYNIRPEQVVTIDPINDNFVPFTDELSGGLNEHNFPSGTLTREHLAEDAGFILHLSQPTNIGNQDDGYGDPSGANWVSILRQDGWQTFGQAGLKKIFEAKGGPAWLCASFNIHCGKNRSQDFVPQEGGGGLESVSIYAGKGFGYLIALRLNGAILHESLLGSGDTGEDNYRQTAFKRQAFFDSDNLESEPRPLRLPQGGGGLSGARLPIVVDTVVELVPGQNTLEVAIMNIKGSMQNHDGTNSRIGKRELFILEMVR